MSTMLAGLPFSGPIGGVRVALIKGQWVGFPTHPQLDDATFDMVVAGRKAGDDAAPPLPDDPDLLVGSARRIVVGFSE